MEARKSDFAQKLRKFYSQDVQYYSKKLWKSMTFYYYHILRIKVDVYLLLYVECLEGHYFGI